MKQNFHHLLRLLVIVLSNYVWAPTDRYKESVLQWHERDGNKLQSLQYQVLHNPKNSSYSSFNPVSILKCKCTIQFVNITLSLKVVLTQLTPSVYTQIFSLHSAKLKVSVKTVCVGKRNVLIHIHINTRAIFNTVLLCSQKLSCCFWNSVEGKLKKSCEHLELESKPNTELPFTST